MAERTVFELKDWFAKESVAIYGRKFGITGEARLRAQDKLASGIDPYLGEKLTAEGKNNLENKVAAQEARDIREDARTDIVALERAYAELVAERVGTVRLELFKESRAASAAEVAAVTKLSDRQLKDAMEGALDVANFAAGDLLFGFAYSREDSPGVIHPYVERRSELDPEGWGALYEELVEGEKILAAMGDDTEARFDQIWGDSPGLHEFYESVATGT